ncbi:MAG: cytochrome C biogenesis protein [Nitrospirae bacterium CG_4_10_14_0_8_um_filter_41_23]|nr:sulfite exporter TauE/SafE family protein [Nitrospirota bacterium]OIP60459.1 MAG: cytochrome C biogenesis protein [Nitrospirae bacterium CG2_30_41_42]PIQ95247.1 MAG: cytochrome C biogenesis protein [Nitrospirae bacterium CG11_big_fil_rev_8_21_14_0_20_41_14]PIV43897.1 MAG: cytochrome C biogenesis protein [Nitrospirae bacterium CG02_land_8_20_14_3_00_41_53]PIW86526.1 MAG: cytochrome C biogenesis protein [Nitrospirae bacterium CG_4_8_14_3_um_filter_41_47]PIY86194.1 MAG: cytochrome C biogenesis
MEAIFLFTAIWLGILTSVSPCPLATNIAAVSFISRRITQRNTVFLSGILYTLGRSLTYIVLGVLIVKTLVDVPILSDFLQRYVNKILGIVLILVGMVLLDLLRIPLTIPSVSENVAKKLAEKGTFSSLPLGILFALAFCPVSAALFFGGLIPIAVKAKSGIGLPLIYGIGTGLPVLLFAFLAAAGSGYINNLYHRITRIEFYTKKITGIIFILVGIYYALAYIFEVI